MTAIPIKVDWLPLRDAARALAVHPRTLQRRARTGRIDTRPGPGDAILYAVPRAVPSPRTPPPTPRRDNPPASTPPDRQHRPDPVAGLVGQIGVLSMRAARAELEAERLRAELADVQAERDRVVAIARDLEARLIKRGEILRRVAAASRG